MIVREIIGYAKFIRINDLLLNCIDNIVSVHTIRPDNNPRTHIKAIKYPSSELRVT